MFMKETNGNAEERIASAIGIAWRYGQIDGEKHKMWIIDQMVRALFENEIEYSRWVRAYEVPTLDYNCYEWNTGIAPEDAE